VFGKWANENYPDEMKAIQQILWDENGVEKYYNRGIIYHSWVSKKELARGWSQSEYWLYPCKFAETFCLTALEAARSKTLAICNNLGALVDVVGDRGVIINGDSTTEEWKQNTLEKLKEISSNEQTKKELIEKNYEWSLTHTWESQSQELFSKLELDNTTEIIPSHNNNFIKLYKNDLICDVYQRSQKPFDPKVQEVLNDILSKDSIVIEAGSFVGIQTMYLSKMVKRIYAFEPFIKSCEILLENISQNNINNVIIYNKALSNENGYIEIMSLLKETHKGSSSVLNNLSVKIVNKVKKVCADDIVPDMIDLILIDVEDHTKEILERSADILKKSRPFVLVKEYDTNEKNSLLISLGYTRREISYPYVLYEY